MSIYLTRHGQTDWNKKLLIQGRIDVPLNDEGVLEAKKLREKVDLLPIDLIISSPLLRTRQTAAILNENKKLKVVIDERIIEEFYGQMEGKPRKGEPYLSQRQKVATRYPGGESYLDVAYRIFSFLNEAKSIYKDKNVLVVSHGGVSRLFNAYFEDMSNEEFFAYNLGNCEIKKYDFVY